MHGINLYHSFQQDHLGDFGISPGLDDQLTVSEQLTPGIGGLGGSPFQNARNPGCNPKGFPPATR